MERRVSKEGRDLERKATQIVARFVRWYVETLHAPAPLWEIESILSEKCALSDLAALGLVEHMAAAGDIRYVAHDFLPNGYAPVEDPS